MSRICALFGFWSRFFVDCVFWGGVIVIIRVFCVLSALFYVRWFVGCALFDGVG